MSSGWGRGDSNLRRPAWKADAEIRYPPIRQQLAIFKVSGFPFQFAKSRVVIRGGGCLRRWHQSAILRSCLISACIGVSWQRVGGWRRGSFQSLGPASGQRRKSGLRFDGQVLTGLVECRADVRRGAQEEKTRPHRKTFRHRTLLLTTS